MPVTVVSGKHCSVLPVLPSEAPWASDERWWGGGSGWCRLAALLWGRTACWAAGMGPWLCSGAAMGGAEGSHGAVRAGRARAAGMRLGRLRAVRRQPWVAAGHVVTCFEEAARGKVPGRRADQDCPGPSRGIQGAPSDGFLQDHPGGSRISVWNKHHWSQRAGGFLGITLLCVLLPALAAQGLPRNGAFSCPEYTGPFASTAGPQH